MRLKQTQELWDAIEAQRQDAVRAALAAGASPTMIGPVGHAAVHQVIHQLVLREEQARRYAKANASPKPGGMGRVHRPGLTTENNIRNAVAFLRIFFEHDPECVDVRDRRGGTALGAAARLLEGDVRRRVVTFLLAAGADARARDHYGRTVWSGDAGDEDAAAQLLRAAGAGEDSRCYRLEDVYRPELLTVVFTDDEVLPRHEKITHPQKREVIWRVWLTKDERKIAAVRLKAAEFPARLSSSRGGEWAKVLT